MKVNVPTIVRKIAYIVFGVIGVGQGAAYSAYNAIDKSTPDGLLAFSAAYSSIVAAPFVVAVLNIDKGDPALKVPGAPDFDSDVDEHETADDVDAEDGDEPEESPTDDADKVDAAEEEDDVDAEEEEDEEGETNIEVSKLSVKKVLKAVKNGEIDAEEALEDEKADRNRETLVKPLTDMVNTDSEDES